MLFDNEAHPVRTQPLGPLMEGAGINITVVSYLDSIDYGVIACQRSVPHVSDIAVGFGAAVAELHKIALDEARKTTTLRRER